jgi:hypothetical protein
MPIDSNPPQMTKQDRPTVVAETKGVVGDLALDVVVHIEADVLPKLPAQRGSSVPRLVLGSWVSDWL